MTFIREVIKNTGHPTLHYEFKCNGKTVLITKTAFDREGWEEVVEEHKCKYCGNMTVYPDKECYDKH